MTFILPEVGGGTPGSSAMKSMSWLDWTGSLAPEALARDMAETNLKLLEASLRLLMLPFAALGVAGPESAEPVVAAPSAPQIPDPVDLSPATTDAHPAPVDDVAGSAPALLRAPEGKPDDLLLIKGIGPKLNQLLNSLGVWHYRQIVSWTPAEVSWVNAKIDFKGRIQRERWQPQAAELMKVRKAA
jgi:predicted flap endonuclease-1-like 5' DNA nuclease